MTRQRDPQDTKFNSQNGRPGLDQTLSVLDRAAEEFYVTPIRSVLKGLSSIHEPHILEVGAGIGSVTKWLCQFGKVTAVDINPEYVLEIQRRFKENPSVQSYLCDVTVEPENLPPFLRRSSFDLIVSINVLEHLKNDRACLSHWKTLLKPGGKMALIVPSHPILFSDLDRSVGHFRRYQKSELLDKIQSAGFAIRSCDYINPLGALGWFVQHKLLGRKTLSASSIRAYQTLKPVFQPIEALLSRFFGLSLYVVVERPIEVIQNGKLPSTGT